jgi:hypothetical protein
LAQYINSIVATVLLKDFFSLKKREGKRKGERERNNPPELRYNPCFVIPVA